MRSQLSLGATLHQLSCMIDQQSETMLQQKFRIGFSQFKILSALLWRDNVRQREIADFLDQTEASISRQIGLMQDAGLVSSRRDAQNRRQRITSLTGKGAQVAKQAVAALEAHHAPMFQRLTLDQQAELQKTLEIMYDFMLTREGR